ncbi:MAG: hypothetical protein K2M27_04855 [Muribaculaceae bacterium]|nr:hypothetical protein [Muribaculaceae bacterium]
MRLPDCDNRGVVIISSGYLRMSGWHLPDVYDGKERGVYAPLFSVP